MVDPKVGGGPRSRGVDAIHRALRVAMVAYLSPLILVVLAFGYIGVLVSGLGAGSSGAGHRLAHRAHKKAGPVAASKAPARVRERV